MEAADKIDEYFETRFTVDDRRKVLWNALTKYFSKRYLNDTDTVLELGAGHGYFINGIKAKRKIAVDQWPGFIEFIDPNVETHVSDVSKLGFLQKKSIDFAFASNLFEHVLKEDLVKTLAQLKDALTERGTLNLLQPNYRFCYNEYFDDYTHVSVFSDRSMCDFLEANGFKVIECIPRFLPLTIKSRFPVKESLIQLYLNLPFKPMGKQMFIRAKVR